MSTLNCIENYIDNEHNHYGCFLIEPLEIGQGITLGNALRRTLLSDLTGFAITGVRINNLKHEFSTIEGLREDVLEVLLNLKEIIFKNLFLSKNKNNFDLKAFLNVKGPVIVTAGMLKLPKDTLTILNPEQYICTIVDNSDFYLSLDIENGKGYKLTEEARKQKIEKKLSALNPTTLCIDSLFMPIKKVNYKIKLIHDSKGNIKESLILEIVTNSSITPQRSLQEALKILIELFSSLFLIPEFLKISQKLRHKKIYLSRQKTREKILKFFVENKSVNKDEKNLHSI
jgi:DNA-directed RNA polymerase subunit alpha